MQASQSTSGAIGGGIRSHLANTVLNTRESLIILPIFPAPSNVSSMDQAVNYITPQGFKKLQEEFRQLFHDERPKLVETVTWAAGNGDRSENGDYIYGKRRLREIDRRLQYLRDRIESAQVVDPAAVVNDRVVFGATVTIIDDDGERKSYQIVGEDEIEPGAYKISWKSPMAKALLGKRIGDEIEIHRPAGVLLAEVVELHYK